MLLNVPTLTSAVPTSGQAVSVDWLVIQCLTEAIERYTIGTYISQIGNMNQDEKIKQIHIKLGAKLHQALKLEAALCNQTIQELVVEIIEQRILRSEFSNFLSNDK